VAAKPTSLTKRPEWRRLEEHFEKIRDVHLRTLFADDPKRGERLGLEAVGSLPGLFEEPRDRRDPSSACRPVLNSRCCRLVSVQLWMASGKTSRRKRLPRL
jgi:hypothetical protein